VKYDWTSKANNLEKEMNFGLLTATLGFVIKIGGETESEPDLLEKNLEYMTEQESTPSDVKERLEYMLDARDNTEDETDRKFWERMSNDYLRSQALPSLAALSSKLNFRETPWVHPISFLEEEELKELKNIIDKTHNKRDWGLEEAVVEEKARQVQSPADFEQVKKLYRVLVTREMPMPS
jgi:hypothetical protein